MMEPRIIPQEKTKIGDIAGKTFKRTLVKGEELRRTSIINSGFISRVGLDQKNLDQLSNLYIVSGEPNYISAQVGILKLLGKKDLRTIFNETIDNSTFLCEKHFPLLIGIKIYNYATSDYIKRHSYVSLNSMLPKISIDLMVDLEDDGKYLIKPHGQGTYGLYGPDCFYSYMDKEIELKHFLGPKWEKTLKEMEIMAIKSFETLEEKFGHYISEIEIEFAQIKNSNYTEPEIAIADFEIRLLNNEHLSHKKGETVKEVEAGNYQLAKMLKLNL